MAQIMNSLLPNHTEIEESRETTRPFRFDLSHIPFDYTVEVTNRFKELDLIDRLPEELWTEVRDIVQESVIKTHCTGVSNQDHPQEKDTKLTATKQVNE